MSDVVFILCALGVGAVTGGLVHLVVRDIGLLSAVFLGCIGAGIAALIADGFGAQRELALAIALAFAAFNVYATDRFDWWGDGGSSGGGNGYDGDSGGGDGGGGD